MAKRTVCLLMACFLMWMALSLPTRASGDEAEAAPETEEAAAEESALPAFHPQTILLSPDGKLHATKSRLGRLRAGTEVTCLKVKGNWMRIPSGWICCKPGNIRK